MEIQALQVGSIPTNCYLVFDPGRTDALVIDPGDNPERIFAALNGRTPAAVLLTHGHFDHTGALSAFAGVPIYIHEADAPMLSDPHLSVGDGNGDLRPRPAATHLLADGEQLHLAGLDIAVLHTPGHTPGSYCFLCGDLFITGDTLFAGSIGRTDLEGGSYPEMEKSLARLLSLPVPDQAQVLPGHGEFSTFGREKKTNGFLQF